MRGAERSLHHEVTFRLAHVPLDAVWLSPPNGVYLPAHTDAEKKMVGRLINRMKSEGQLTAGAADLIFMWRDGAGAIELKRPATSTLFDKMPAGKPSEAQKRFAALCQKHGVKHAYCTSWAEVREVLRGWGRIPATWRDADERIGQSASETIGYGRGLTTAPTRALF